MCDTTLALKSLGTTCVLGCCKMERVTVFDMNLFEICHRTGCSSGMDAHCGYALASIAIDVFAGCVSLQSS